MGGKNYIPSKDAEFSSWFHNILHYVQAKTAGTDAEWTNIPVSDVEELDAAYTDWCAYYEPATKPHTPAVTVDKNNARRRAEKVIRPFVQRFLHWKPVTDSDRENMGIPTRAASHTAHINVSETVEVDLKLRNIREILVMFWVKGSLHKARPRGYDGALIVFDVLDAPPKHLEDLKRHAIASRTSHALSFPEAERGRRVYIAVAWLNARGHTGAFCRILSAVIP